MNYSTSNMTFTCDCASNMANYHEMGLVSGLELVHLLYGMTRFATMNFLPCIVIQNTAGGKKLEHP